MPPTKCSSRTSKPPVAASEAGTNVRIGLAALSPRIRGKFEPSLA